MINSDCRISSCNRSGGCTSCSSEPTGFIIERPLGKITAVLADLGLEVTYAYDDLIFVQHAALLLQFTGKPDRLKLYMHAECRTADANAMAATMVIEFSRSGFTLEPSGKYLLSQNRDETLRVEFV
jgi:hypothetical protein